MNQPGTNLSDKSTARRRVFGLENAFSTEDLLQQAIAGLLTRMPDVSGVQILQGAQEFGKDIVFYIKGGFEELILCACVVKNAKISGDAAKSGGARVIFNQAQQAFDSPHADGSGKEIRVERVYVVTPYDLPPTTISSIKGRLQERSGQILFMGGPTLFDLFKRYWPDYFADEAAAIEIHIKETKDLVDLASPLEGLGSHYNLGSMRSHDKKVYVRQGLYRELSKFSFSTAIRDILPSERQIHWQIEEKQVREIKEKLNSFARFVTFVNEWRLCSNEESRKIVELCNQFSETLNGILGEIERERKRNAQELSERERERKKAAAKDFEGRKRVEKQESRIDFVSPAKTQLENLTEAHSSILARLDPYLRQLNSTISAWSFEGLEALADPSYLSACIVDEFARSAPQGFFHSEQGVRLSLPKEILSKWTSHVMIVGAPGYGKTSFCRWHALHDAESFNAGTSKIVPVYVPLSRFSTKPLGSFEDTFLQNLGKSALLNESSVGGDTRVRIYLDGLDEIASEERRRQLVELVKTGVQAKNKYQIILTSRDYIYGRWLDWIPRIALGGLEDTDISELIDKWLGTNSESNKLFRHELKSIPMHQQLMRTPLLATLVILVFRQTNRLPENRTRLYEIFTNLLSGGWDLAKGVLRHSKFGERIKIMVLSNLAGSLHERRRSEFTPEDVKEASRAVLSGSHRDDWELLLQEFIVDGLIGKSGDVMHFSHLSFQEFLAAKDFIGTPHPTRINNALQSFLWGDGWWKELIKFYIGLSSSPKDIKDWLSNRLRQFHLSAVAEVSSSQVQELLIAIAEAFPGHAKGSLSEAERLLQASRV